ncbi:C-X-C motif chemokine 13 [Sparus aurata]|uniref:Chemokine interleukin-8-like domain-containing protein n=1 Tax=Sparus aurata TaxID=8175 RepID=A0A671XBS7_SPAAU|nr:C-X-C motif chemokine 13 [Sparus aurata]
MMMKPLLLLAALTLCIGTLHAFPRRQTCLCIRTISTRVPLRVIKKVEVFPVSGHCRHTEVIITRKNNTKVCIDPEAGWFKDLMNHVKENSMATSPTVPAVASSVSL